MSNQRAVAAAREGRLVVFAGAGVSVAPPTALPSWWGVNQAVVSAIAEEALEFVPHARSLAAVVIARQVQERFPPDYVAEKIVHSVKERYFEVLRCIDSDRANENHLTLADLAGAGHLKVILTTNFDRTFEAAFRARGVPLEVSADPAAVRSLLARWPELEAGALPCQLIKLHGTADRADTIIDTLSQRKIGLAPELTECATRLLAFASWLFLGFSGADLEAEPRYLGLRQAAAVGRGFTWLVQPGGRRRAGVIELLQAWPGKAELAEGTLPDWLRSLAAELGVGGSTVPDTGAAVVAPPDIARWTREWARGIGPKRCGLILAELATGCGAVEGGLDALENLASSFPQHAWKVAYRFSGGTLVVRADADGVPHGVPAGFGADANRAAVAVLAPDVSLPNDDRANYSDVLYGLGDLLARVGREEESVRVLVRSIVEGIALRRGHDIVRAIAAIADGRAAQGNTGEAEQLYRAAVLCCDPGWRIKANLLFNWSRLVLGSGAPERQGEGLRMVLDALTIFQQLGDERGTAAIDLVLAPAALARNEAAFARARWEHAIEVATRIGDDPILWEASLGMGKLLASIGDVAAARQALQTAVVAARSHGDAEREATAREALESLPPS